MTEHPAPTAATSAAAADPAVTDAPAREPGDPYCGGCGYPLRGLTDSARCPECGRPLVEVLMRRGYAPATAGRRYRSAATLFGLPVLDIALGPHGDEPRGRARGVIAVGDVATGWLAVGGIARGIVAIGGMAVGVFAFGGLAVGLVTAAGGTAVGGLAAGGVAVGVVASGGLTAGIIAQGGLALGAYARGGVAWGRADPVVFDRFAWVFGTYPPTGAGAYRPILVALAPAVVTALAVAAVAWWRAAWRRRAG